jgi:hypothetical protein
MQTRHVNFPVGARPEESPVYAYNELFVPAPPERVWQWLVQAARWPEFYANARNIHLDGDAPELAAGTAFSWITFGVRVHTKIEELEPNRRLSWSGRGLGATAYHGWVIIPVAGGCRVITEETQQGLVASLGRAFLRRGLLKWHQRWLEGLARVAASGSPAALSSAALAAASA